MKKKFIWLVGSILMVLVLLAAACAPAPAKEVAPKEAAPAVKEAAPVVKEVSPAVKEAAPAVKEAAPAVEKEMITVTLTKLDGTKMTKTVEKPQYGGVFTYNLPAGNIQGSDETMLPGPGPYWNTQIWTNDELISGDYARSYAGTGETHFDMSSATFIYPVTKGHLAESWEFVDDQTFTFTIRQGIRFALDPNSEASRLVGGRQLTAADVVFSVDRAFNTPTSYNAINYPPADRPVVTIDPNNKWKVIFKTKPGMTYQLFAKGDLIRIVAPEVVKKYGDLRDWRNAVGTGPWLLKEFLMDSFFYFERNPNYWQTDPVLGKDYQLPYVDAAKVLIIPDMSTIISAARTRKLDFVYTGLTRDDWMSLKKTNPEMEEYKAGGAGPTIFLRVDRPELPWAPEFDAKALKVRRALAMAVDQPGMLRDLLNGDGQMLYAPVSRYNKEAAPLMAPLEEQSPDVRELFEYHPDKAKQLLAEAGYPNGFKTELTYWNGVAPYIADEFSLVKAQWAKVGVDVELKPMEAGAIRAMQGAKAYPGMTHVSWFGWSTIFENRQKFFPTAAENYAQIKDQKIVDGLIAMEKELFNMDVQARISKEIYAHWLAQATVIQLPGPNSYNVWQPWVKNFYGQRSIGLAQYMGSFVQYLWIDQALKKSILGK